MSNLLIDSAAGYCEPPDEGLRARRIDAGLRGTAIQEGELQLAGHL